MFWFRNLHRIIDFLKYFYRARYTIYGRENVPENVEGLIAVTNHCSYMDAPMLALCLPQGTRWKLFAARTREHEFITGWLLKKSGSIFIDRTTVDRKGLKEGLDAIKAGYTFGLAPEGTRNKEGIMQKGRNGAAYLAVKSGASVLPVGMVNTELWNVNYPKREITYLEAHIGEAIAMPDLGRRVRTADLDAYTHYIMIHIAQQVPPRYRGYYADSPALAALLRGEDPWPYCLEAEGVTP